MHMICEGSALLVLSLLLLSTGDFYFSDQLLNIQTFSTLRRWILFTHSQPIIDGTAYSPTLTPIPDQV